MITKNSCTRDPKSTDFEVVLEFWLVYVCACKFLRIWRTIHQKQITYVQRPSTLCLLLLYNEWYIAHCWKSRDFVAQYDATQLNEGIPCNLRLDLSQDRLMPYIWSIPCSIPKIKMPGWSSLQYQSQSRKVTVCWHVQTRSITISLPPLDSLHKGNSLAVRFVASSLCDLPHDVRVPISRNLLDPCSIHFCRWLWPGYYTYRH